MTHEKKELKWTVTLVALLAIPAAFLLVTGCEGDEPIDEGASGQGISGEAAAAGEAAVDKSRKMGHHGKMGHHKKGHCPSRKLLRYALKTLDLTDEQRATLEGLRDSSKDGKGAGHRGFHADLHEAFVKALKTGELDRAALEAKTASKQELIENKLEARNTKLATLHATLTPKQRKTLVDTVRAKMAAKAARYGDKGKHGKGWHGYHGKMMFHGMLEGLDLTAEQRTQIEALKAKGAAQRPADEDWSEKKKEKLAQMSTLLDAFVADDFDPAESAPAPRPMKTPVDKIGFHLDQLETLLGILTAKQRAQLAEKIESHPGKMGHGQ
jgi:Spy/CpxP family protein refolding chaperone